MQSVKIKKDKWLPIQTSRTPILAPPDMLQQTKASAHINIESGEWKKELVQSSFLPHEVVAILGIPLSSKAPSDRIVWAHTPSGLFSTSTAFKRLVSCASIKNVGSSDPVPNRKFWNGIW